MKIIYLVRHAESIANAGGKTVTPDSIDLSENGKAQAKQLTDNFPEEPDLIVTSPFIRTLRTAEPLLEKYPNSKHEQWPVQEFTYLSPAKYNNTTMEARIPFAIEYWERNDPYYCDGDGAESFSNFLKRIDDGKNRLKARSERCIIVYSHYQFIAAFKWLDGKKQKAVSGGDMAEFRQYLFTHQLENAGILKFESLA